MIQYYTVKPGDSMWSIANDFSLNLNSLIAANPQIGDPEQIYPGQMILIPGWQTVPICRPQNAENPNMGSMQGTNGGYPQNSNGMQTPDMQTPDMQTPDMKKPGLQIPSMPGIPGIPGVPKIPGIPIIPGIPGIPSKPGMPQMPEMPQTPEMPQKPEMPQTPEKPQTPTEPRKPGTEPFEPSDLELQVVELVNNERTSRGLAPLEVNETLSQVARTKADDMATNNYFSHQSPNYGSPFDMMRMNGITYTYAGENIAKGQPTAESVVNSWMNSASHRENILNSNYTQIGVGYADPEGVPFWSQMFIRP